MSGGGSWIAAGEAVRRATGGNVPPAADAVRLREVLDLAQRDEAGGLPDLPYPPNYPKMPGEPPRVQPSRKNPQNWDDA